MATTLSLYVALNSEKLHHGSSQSVEANFYRGYWYRMYCAIVINNLNQGLKLLILKIPLFSGFVTGLCFFYLWNLGLPVIILTM